MGLAAYCGKRILIGLAMIVCVQVIIFLAIQVVPGDPVEAMLSETAGIGPDVVAALRQQFGLDKPMPVRLLNHVIGLLRLDFGISFQYSQPAFDIIASRLAVSIELVVLAAFFGITGGILLGSLSVQTRWGDRLVSILGPVILSVPGYVLGSVLILGLSLSLGWLPAGGVAPFSDPAEHVRRLVLPVVTLALPIAATIAKVTRFEILEVRTQDWVRTSRAYGFPTRVTFRRDILRNALTPVLTISALELGGLIGATVLVEKVFNLSGLGSLLVSSVSVRDYPLIQGAVFVISAFYIAINIISDIMYGFLDPRVSKR
ncbi:peptide/nickel transport system permease protein [Pseudochelatococcus lubricantis]|uniref:Peptide/nickel transport system permease protein n=1 Tax=Pseudochelatococcus lubricantis TaxID=1538102 RepID=A0ABX0V3K2_9HYPH|nr:ABC transporter permease [Pseudochelatococcus lubricantis]NIJ58815.1 peptide/nickel transport system permease protein [Pseudochelatococcus lubricantis]